MVMLVEDSLNVARTLVAAFVASIVESLLVLVEDISSQQVCQEVEACEHKEHEKERIPEVDALGWQENIRVVSCREQDGQIAVSVTDGAKVGDAFERGSVEVVHGEDKHQNVRKDGDKDRDRVFKVREKAHSGISHTSREAKHDHHTTDIRNVWEGRVHDGVNKVGD